MEKKQKRLRFNEGKSKKDLEKKQREEKTTQDVLKHFGMETFLKVPYVCRKFSHPCERILARFSCFSLQR